MPNPVGTKAVCLWDTDDIEAIKRIIEDAVGAVSNGTYFVEKTEHAVGQPELRAGLAGVLVFT